MAALLSYPEDKKDGRPERGLAASCCAVTKTVKPGRLERFQIVFSLEKEEADGWQLLQMQEKGRSSWKKAAASPILLPVSWLSAPMISSPGGTPPAARPSWQATPCSATGAGIP